MNLDHLFENDPEQAHWDSLKNTGYYGAQGAGCLFYARSTGRLLLALRSRYVEQSGTWGTIGGAIDPHESPEVAARREAEEEAGATGKIDLVPIYVFRDKKFRYSNFLAIVDEEFEAHDTQRLGFRETDRFQWFEFGHWPSPLHFGVKAILVDPTSITFIQDLRAARAHKLAGSAS